MQPSALNNRHSMSPRKKRNSTMNIQTPSGAIDLAAIKGRQQIA
jgi:hypothetical protein